MESEPPAEPTTEAEVAGDSQETPSGPPAPGKQLRYFKFLGIMDIDSLGVDFQCLMPLYEIVLEYLGMSVC